MDFSLHKRKQNQGLEMQTCLFFGSAQLHTFEIQGHSFEKRLHIGDQFFFLGLANSLAFSNRKIIKNICIFHLTLAAL